MQAGVCCAAACRVHTEHFHCWKFSLAFKRNSSIRDRILSLRLFTQNPTVNYFPSKALKRAMAISFFLSAHFPQNMPEEKGRDAALLCALPQLP